MYINKQINNIFYNHKRKISHSNTNILYEKTHSFFDAAIFSDSSHSLLPIIINDNNQYLIENIFYSGLWINDIIQFSQKIPAYANFYTDYILAIHSAPSSLFKREDLMILKKNINQYPFVCFGEFKNTWPMENITYIPYGVKNPGASYTKSKDILVINQKKQKQTDILYQYLKQQYALTDILHSAPSDINEVHNILSQYKVCIDIDNYYNLLVANACGCIGITALQSNDADIISVNNSNKIFHIINNLIIENDYNKISNQTIEKYSWEMFCSNMRDYGNKVLNKEFII